MNPLIPSSNKNTKSPPQGAPLAQDEKRPNAVPRSDIAPNAEVWKKYVEETDRYDKDLVDGWNSSLDMLLIFVRVWTSKYVPLIESVIGGAVFGYFGSWLNLNSRFVLESTQDLKPDYAETSAQMLADILQVVSSGNPANSSSFPEAGQPAFSPSSTAVTVNILWFMSLSLSVAVALIAIVAKDWCYQFMSGRNGAFLTQGRRRQLRWEGIEKWKMQEMLNVLPLMMHAALLLFAAGLVLYLWDINPRVALPVLVTTIIVGVFYLVTLFLPLFFRYCPFAIGLMKLVLPYWYKIPRSTFESMLQVLGNPFVPLVATVTLVGRLCRRDAADNQVSGSKHSGVGFRRWIPRVSLIACWDDSKQKIKDRISRFMGNFLSDKAQLVGQEAPMDEVTSAMLGWMITQSENPDSANPAYRALVCTKPWLPREPLVKPEALEAGVTRLSAYMIAWEDADHAGDGNSKTDLTSLVILLSQSVSTISHVESIKLPEDYLEVMDSICWILPHCWHSRDEIGYSPVSKALGSLSLHLSDGWRNPLRHRGQFYIQEPFLEQITTGQAAGISPEEICYLLDGITKSYLYEPDQSPDLLIKLLHIPEYENHPQLRRKLRNHRPPFLGHQ